MEIWMEILIEDYRELWENKRGRSVGHSPAIWDVRADDWISEVEAEPERKLARVKDTADFLRLRGLLIRGHSVVDVGCGPGLFPYEFAKTAGSALGLDFSQRFVDYATEKAKAAGVNNVRYEYCDFLKDDTSAYNGKFDLAFSSITPATGTWESMQKLVLLSRAYCCNVSFVNVSDTLAEQISREVFEEEFKPRWDGTSFYALMNIVWLEGHYPETHYYDDVREDIIEPTRGEAEYFAQLCKHYESEDAEKTLRWLEEKGEQRCLRKTRYGLILWDIRRKDKR
jgi:SAM-dependent methyltransferase